jgi:hypothetical protein
MSISLLIYFPYFLFLFSWDARISYSILSFLYLIPLYVFILVSIFHVSAFRILDILSSSLGALVTDSVCNLIPRTPSLGSCPLGTMKDDMAVGTGNGRICRLSCLFSRVMSGR